MRIFQNIWSVGNIIHQVKYVAVNAYIQKRRNISNQYSNITLGK